MLDPLAGLSAFQIWRECRPRFRDTNLAKKTIVDVRIFSRLGRLKMLVLKNHFDSKWAVFPESVTYVYVYTCVVYVI